jgi:hypothetical protein
MGERLAGTPSLPVLGIPGDHPSVFGSTPGGFPAVMGAASLFPRHFSRRSERGTARQTPPLPTGCRRYATAWLAPWLRTASILLAGRGGVWLTLLPPLCWSKKCRGKRGSFPMEPGTFQHPASKRAGLCKSRVSSAPLEASAARATPARARTNVPTQSAQADFVAPGHHRRDLESPAHVALEDFYMALLSVPAPFTGDS